MNKSLPHASAANFLPAAKKSNLAYNDGQLAEAAMPKPHSVAIVILAVALTSAGVGAAVTFHPDARQMPERRTRAEMVVVTAAGTFLCPARPTRSLSCKTLDGERVTPEQMGVGTP